jgi:hypothetical protein
LLANHSRRLPLTRFAKRLFRKRETNRRLLRQIGRVEGVMEMCNGIEHFKQVAARQRTITIASYLFDEMNRIIE